MAYQLTKRMKDYANSILPQGFCVISTSQFDEVRRRIIIDHQRTLIQLARLKEQQPIQPQQFIQPQQPLDIQDKKKKKDRWDWEGIPKKQKLMEKLRNAITIVRRHQACPLLNDIQSDQMWLDGIFLSLNGIQDKIKRSLYNSAQQFISDLNCSLDDSMVLQPSEQLSKNVTQLKEEINKFLQEMRLQEFQIGLNEFQKQVDKVTRVLRDVQENGHFYYKRVKRTDKHPDQRDYINVFNMLNKLKQPYLVGVWEIINQTPGRTASGQLMFNIDQLKPKKFRELQHYLKTKLNISIRSNQLRRCKRGDHCQSSDSSVITDEQQSD